MEKYIKLNKDRTGEREGKKKRFPFHIVCLALIKRRKIKESKDTMSRITI